MKVFNSMWRTATLAASLALAAISATPAYAVRPSGYILILSNNQPGYLLTDTNAPVAALVQGFASDIVGKTFTGAASTAIYPGLVKANNFFAFPISSLTSPVTSASLNYAYNYTWGPGKYRIFDVTPSYFNNTSLFEQDSASLMNALEQGPQIGTLAFGDHGNGLLSINFNSDGIAALNNQISNESGVFIIGGSVAPTAPAPLAGGGVLAALAAAIALLVTRGRGFFGGLPGFRKLGTA